MLLSLAAAVLMTGCNVKVGKGDEPWNRLVVAYRHNVEVAGSKMHYIDMGQGEPVLMIHGYADSSYTWNKNAQALVNAGFRVILVDQPGLGRSEIPPKPYAFTVENQAARVLELMDRIGIKRFDVVGSSQGGGIALDLIVFHPERIRRAVLFSPACFPRSRMGAHSVLSLPAADQLGAALTGRWTVDAALKTVYFDPKKVTRAIVDEYSRPWNKAGYVAVLASLGRDFFSPVFRDMSKRYGFVTTPILIVWGEKDRWLSPKDGRNLHEVIRSSKLVTIPNCGHLPHQERPELANQLMLDFLRGK